MRRAGNWGGVLAHLHQTADAIVDPALAMTRVDLDECKALQCTITRRLVEVEAAIIDAELEKLARAPVRPAEEDGVQMDERARPGRAGMLVVARAYAQSVSVVNMNGWIQTAGGRVLTRGWDNYAVLLEARGRITETPEGWVTA